jgi:hypothetical protein
MKRRELIQILAAGPAAAAQPKFLTPAEAATLETLSEIIVPGAKKARVPWYIETVLANSPVAAQQEWRRGLAAVAAEFSRVQPVPAVAAMARGEASPKTELERFFVTAKRMTVDGYIYSEEGARDLGLGGHHIHRDFPGCAHPEHQS